MSDNLELLNEYKEQIRILKQEIAELQDAGKSKDSANKRCLQKLEHISIDLQDANNTIKELKDHDRIAFSYVDNPNGSMGNIAGILSENRRVLGMMPHPERLNDPMLGGIDGNRLFQSIYETLVTS